MTCNALVAGCGDCEAEQAYKNAIGHECGPQSEHFSTLCEVWGESRRNDAEFHRISHEPERCEVCNAPVSDQLGLDNTVRRLCPAKLCVHVECAFCGAGTVSFGPIDCPYCGSLGRHPRIARMRHLYRVKRRHW